MRRDDWVELAKFSMEVVRGVAGFSLVLAMGFAGAELIGRLYACLF